MVKFTSRKRRRTSVRSKRSRSSRRTKRTRNVPVLWPMKKAVRLNYATTNGATSIAGTAAQYVLSCNGMFDPDITGTGHQPKGFDQIMPFYDHYTVIGSRIFVEFQNNEQHPIRVGIMIRDQNPGTLGNNITAIGEYRFKKFITLDGTTRGGKSWGSVSMALNPAKYLGRSHPMSDPDMKGTVAANPVEQCFFVVYAYALDATSTVDVTMAIKIDYSRIFTEPRIGTTS